MMAGCAKTGFDSRRAHHGRKEIETDVAIETETEIGTATWRDLAAADTTRAARRGHHHGDGTAHARARDLEVPVLQAHHPIGAGESARKDDDTMKKRVRGSEGRGGKNGSARSVRNGCKSGVLSSYA